MTTDKLTFRSLFEELEVSKYHTLAGFHDLERAFVLSKHSGNRLVAGHEMIHDRLLTETAFGELQRLFREASNDTQEANTKTSMNAWLELLISNSLVTHEAAATYLSIKNFPVEMESEILATLPRMYKEYYYTLSNVVDAAFSSTYAQYIVAKIIVEIAMAPRLVERLISWTPNIAIELKDDEKPDKRLNDLLKDLAPRMQELVQHIYRNINATKSEISLDISFDYQDEGHWLQLVASDGPKIDALIHDIVRPWMYSVAKSLWPVLVGEEWSQLNNRFRQTLWDYVDNYANVNEYKFLKRIQLDSATIKEALRYGISAIANRSNVAINYAALGENDIDPISVFTEPIGPRLFITSQIITEKIIPSWYSFVPATSGDNFYALHLSHRLFIKALQFRRWFIGQGGLFEEVEAIIIGVNSGDVSGFQDLHNEIVELHTLGNAVFGLDKIIWYLAGDFFWWYDLLTAIDDNLEIMSFYDPKALSALKNSITEQKLSSYEELLASSTIGELARERSSRGIDSGYGDWFILRSSKVQGLMLRILPVQTDPSFGEIIIQELESGVLKIVPSSERDKLAAQVLKAGRPIITCWPEF